MAASSGEEAVCAICKTAETSADNITQEKLLVNVKCGHRFHQACAEKALSRKSYFTCPRCNIQVRRTGLTEKTIDELDVAKDVTIRKRIMKIYNRSEEDFADLGLYNNYLEEREDIIFNLCSGTDPEETAARVKAYEEANRAEITRNTARRVDDERLLSEEIAAQRQAQETRKHYIQLEEARKDQHARKLKLEAQEVALGERQEITATLSDVLHLGDDVGGGEAQALPAGMRTMLQINAPLPVAIPNSDVRRRYANMDPRKRQDKMRTASAAPRRPEGYRRDRAEFASSLCLAPRGGSAA